MVLQVALSTLFGLFCVLLVGGLPSSSSQRRPQVVQVTPRIGYGLNDELLNWMEAYQVCKNWSATLAFPTSPLEGEMLIEFLTDTSDNSTKEIHMGFHSMFGNDSAYTSVEGRDLEENGFRQWDPASEDGPDQRCGGLSVAGMKTIDCNTRQESVCEFKESLYYDEIEGFGYYRFHDLFWNWTDAISTCKIERANLLVLRSTEEYDAVFNHFSETGAVNGSIDIWYGAHQLFGDQFYLTLGDEPIDDAGYTVWAAGEPGDVTSADFPLVGLHLTNLTTPNEEAGLFAFPWGTPMQFICKQELH